MFVCSKCMQKNVLFLAEYSKLVITNNRLMVLYCTLPCNVMRDEILILQNAIIFSISIRLAMVWANAVGSQNSFDPLTPLLGFGHGHGHHVLSFKSVELKQIAWLPVIHIDHGHISYRFQHKRQFQLKIVVFPPVYLMFHWGFPSEFCNCDEVQKTTMILLPHSRKSCLHLDTIAQHDGKTDGWNCLNNIALYMLALCWYMIKTAETKIYI